MQIDNLDDFDPGSEFEADIAIIGAGPAGITIAREFLNSPYRVLLIESGLVDQHELVQPAGPTLRYARAGVWRIGEILGRQVRDLRPNGFRKARLGTLFRLAGQS